LRRTALSHILGLPQELPQAQLVALLLPQLHGHGCGRELLLRQEVAL
jgi:hypothetical protein